MVPSTRRRRRLLALLLVGLGALVAGCTSTSAAAPSSTAARDIGLRVDGRDRSYLLQPALGLPQGHKAALVVVLHQEGGTSDTISTETELQGLRSAGATLVYPAGVDHSWDAGQCCGPARRQGVDDLTFLDRVLDDVPKHTPVDRAHTAFVGYSSGGMLTYRYVCARPGRLAVAVVVSGSLESPCGERVTIPVMLALHGKRDGTIGLSRPVFVQALGLAPRPAASSLQEITRSAGCGAAHTTQTPATEFRRWSGCRGGDVEAALVKAAGHAWAGLDASRRTQEFLRERLLTS